MILVAWGREDDRTGAPGHRQHAPDPDVRIVLSTSSPNGFLRRAFESGAADMALFPQSKEQLRFAMSKAIARTPAGAGSTSRRRRRSAHLRPRAQGRDGQDLTSCNLAVALALAGQKVLVIDLDLPVRRRRALPRPAAREDDVRPRISGGSLRRRQARGLRHGTRHGRRRHARPGASRPGERDHDRTAPTSSPSPG